MYLLKDITALHLEMTEKCQAGCPLCPRHRDDGSVNPHLINAELSLAQCRDFFPKPFVQQLRRMFMCGNYGDPIIAKDTLEVFEYFRYTNKYIALDMHTNGGARDKDWWKDLAGVLYNDYSSVVFSIDGLQDTNHLYRKNVNWNRIMDSAESFIAAGGNATWSFIVFRHNEHQIDEARRLSEKMGFKKFVPKKSARFARDKVKEHPYLQPPINKEYQNQNLHFIPLLEEKYGDMINFYSQTEIDCLAVKETSIYVSARGLLFPCCWLGGIYEENAQELVRLFGNFDKLDLNKKSMQEIFDTGIFEHVKNKWKCSSFAEGKPKTCSTTCSKEYNFFLAQFE